MNKTMWYGAWTTIVASFGYYTAAMFITLFYCHPRKYIWDKLTPGGKCPSNVATGMTRLLSQAIISMVIDILIMVLGTFSIWKLQMERRKKVAVTVLFGTGLL